MGRVQETNITSDIVHPGPGGIGGARERAILLSASIRLPDVGHVSFQSAFSRKLLNMLTAPKTPTSYVLPCRGHYPNKGRSRANSCSVSGICKPLSPRQDKVRCFQRIASISAHAPLTITLCHVRLMGAVFPGVQVARYNAPMAAQKMILARRHSAKLKPAADGKPSSRATSKFPPS